MDTVNRIHNVSVRLTDNEYKKLIELCHDVGATKGDVLRLNLHSNRGSLKSLQQRFSPTSSKYTTTDFKLLDRLNLLNQNLARTGNLVNQIARVANRTNSTTLSDDDVNNLIKLSNEIDSVKHVVGKLMNQ